MTQTIGRLVTGLFLLAATAHPAPAGKPKAPGLIIQEISPASVSISAGQGLAHSYRITTATTFVVDGLPCGVDDIRAGMAVAKLDVSPDGLSVISLQAKKAPRVTKKPPPPSSTTVIWY